MKISELLGWVNTREAILTGVAVAISTSSSLIYNYATADRAHSPLLVITSIAVFSVVLMVLAFAVLKSRWATEHVGRITELKGHWLITQIGEGEDPESIRWERPRSIAHLHIDSSGCRFDGYGISRNGDKGSHWLSHELLFDEEQLVMTFVAEATVVGSGEQVKNFGHITFEEHYGQIDRGGGYFVDIKRNPQYSDMTLKRISAKEYFEIYDRISSKDYFQTTAG